MARTYDPSKNVVNIAGITITGFAKGDNTIKLTRSTEKWSYEPGGMSSEGVYIKSTDDSAMLELTLQATSPSNRDLSNLYKKDLKDNTGKGAISVEDLNTEQTIFASETGRIMNCPDYGRGDALATVVWKVHLAKLTDSFHDGSIS